MEIRNKKFDNGQTLPETFDILHYISIIDVQKKG